MLYLVAMTTRRSLLVGGVAAWRCAGQSLHADEFPQAELQSPSLTAQIYLPDPNHGYYRGTRFDWSGVIRSLKYKGHEYFGQWFERHDPLVHDAITGPVNVFDPEGAALGYGQAKPGKLFVRIGVGLLEKPDEPSYRGTHTYKVVDAGNWGTKRGNGWIEFAQQIPNQTGYAYAYSKRISLSSGKPQMVLGYRLKNTGTEIIETDQFNHNFFVIDGQVSGPGMVARFGFQPEPVGKADGAHFVQLRGKEVHFLQSLKGQERVYLPLGGFSNSASDYNIEVENRVTGAGVRITSDRPLQKIIFWSRPRVVGPEPYIHIRLQPGETATWETRYEFYTFKAEKGSPSF